MYLLVYGCLRAIPSRINIWSKPSAYVEVTNKACFHRSYVALGGLTATILINPRSSGPEWRTFRLFSFIGTGLSAFAPIAHASLLYGVETLWKIGVGHYFVEGAIIILASYVYEVCCIQITSLIEFWPLVSA